MCGARLWSPIRFPFLPGTPDTLARVGLAHWPCATIVATVLDAAALVGAERLPMPPFGSAESACRYMRVS